MKDRKGMKGKKGKECNGRRVSVRMGMDGKGTDEKAEEVR